jgi:hypothetical protein
MKVIEIEGCWSCPYSKMRPVHQDSDEIEVHCHHPDRETDSLMYETKWRSNRLPNDCPLENLETFIKNHEE